MAGNKSLIKFFIINLQWGRRGSNPYAEALAPKTSVSANFTTSPILMDEEGLESSIPKAWTLKLHVYPVPPLTLIKHPIAYIFQKTFPDR